MPTLKVQARDTPGERADAIVDVQLDEALSVHAQMLEEWAAPLEHWEIAYREGTFFDRPNNVEARLVFAGAEHTCSVVFRLDQIDGVESFDRDLWLTLEEREGIAKAVHLAPLGLDVELHHIVGPPFGGTSS